MLFFQIVLLDIFVTISKPNEVICSTSSRGVLYPSKVHLDYGGTPTSKRFEFSFYFSNFIRAIRANQSSFMTIRKNV